MTKLEALEAKLSALQAEIAEMKREKEWPQKGDTMFELLTTGFVYETTQPDICIISQGNCFRTLQEAEHERDRRALLQELKPFRKGFVPDWSSLQTKNFYIRYAHDAKRYVVDRSAYLQTALVPYFATREDAQSAIDHFGERLKILFEGN